LLVWLLPPYSCHQSRVCPCTNKTLRSANQCTTEKEKEIQKQARIDVKRKKKDARLVVNANAGLSWSYFFPFLLPLGFLPRSSCVSMHKYKATLCKSIDRQKRKQIEVDLTHAKHKRKEACLVFFLFAPSFFPFLLLRLIGISPSLARVCVHAQRKSCALKN